MNTESEYSEHCASCPAPEELVAWVMDPSSVESPEEIEQLVRDCTQCQSIVRDTQEMRQAVSVSDEAPISEGFLEGVLAGIAEEEWQTSPDKVSPVSPAINWYSSPFFKFAAAACLVAICALFIQLGMPDQDFPEELAIDSSIHAGTRWVLEHQNESGGWDVQDLGGRESYAPALNGLAVIALTRSGLEPERVRQPIQDAARHLVGLQHESGRMGPETEGMMYNQGISALAMLEAFALTRDEQLLEPVEKALAFIVEQQNIHGGWGYGQSEDGRPNTSITAWQVQSLLLAKRLGITSNNQPLRKGLAWLTGNVNGSGQFDYEQGSTPDKNRQTLTMMGALCLLTAEEQDIPVDKPAMQRVSRGIEVLSSSMPGDYYAAYFFASALSIADPDAYKVALAEAKSSLESRQLSDGTELGAWGDEDRWGSAGGQIYSTSMALMSLLEGNETEASE